MTDYLSHKGEQEEADEEGERGREKRRGWIREREEGKERKGMRRNNNHNHDDNNNTNISSLGDSHRKRLRRNMPANKKEMKEERKARPVRCQQRQGVQTLWKNLAGWELKESHWNGNLVTDRKGILVEYSSIIHSTNICWWHTTDQGLCQVLGNILMNWNAYLFSSYHS